MAPRGLFFFLALASSTVAVDVSRKHKDGTMGSHRHSHETMRNRKHVTVDANAASARSTLMRRGSSVYSDLGPLLVTSAYPNKTELKEIMKNSKALGIFDVSNKTTQPAKAEAAHKAFPPVVNPPKNTIPGLFRENAPRHRCDPDKQKKFHERFPEQAKSSPRQQQMSKGMAIFHKVLKEHGLPTVLFAGSALGFFRQCELIPDDADADTMMLSHWLAKPGLVDKLKASFQKVGVFLKTDFCPRGAAYTGCEYRAVFFKPDGTYGFHIDIFALAQDEPCKKDPAESLATTTATTVATSTGTSNATAAAATCTFQCSLWSNSQQEGPHALTKYTPCSYKDLHFEQAEFLNDIYWVPAPSLAYVTTEYGDAWQQPGGGVYKSCSFAHSRMPSPLAYGPGGKLIAKVDKKKKV